MKINRKKEKKYNKLIFVLFALILIALSIVCFYGGIYAVVYMLKWYKYLIIVTASIIGLILGILGVLLVALSFNLTNTKNNFKEFDKLNKE